MRALLLLSLWAVAGCGIKNAPRPPRQQPTMAPPQADSGEQAPAPIDAGP